MSRLTRDGTTEPVSRDQILRRLRGQENIHFLCSADHESRIGNLIRLIHTLLTICYDHTYTYIYTYILISSHGLYETVKNYPVNTLYTTDLIYSKD